MRCSGKRLNSLAFNEIENLPSWEFLYDLGDKNPLFSSILAHATIFNINNEKAT